jgi:hypothetical protein
MDLCLTVMRHLHGHCRRKKIVTPQHDWWHLLAYMIVSPCFLFWCEVPHFITSNCYAGCSLQCGCFSEIGLNYVRNKGFNTLV